MSREILQNIIKDFSPDKFVRFFREKNRAFAPIQEELVQYNDQDFKNGLKLGEIKFSDIEQLAICAFQASQPLSERSGKKAQYEKGKRILKNEQYDAGIFIFYDQQGNFRFSLIYANYLGMKRDWSNFRRFTYFVSKEFTNKTFLNQIGATDFISLEKIKDAFSVEKVTKEFYEEIANWYFWAIDKVEFPDDEDKNREVRNAKNLIRLITRIVFVWFMKVKKLIPETLFDKKFVDNILNYKDKTGSTYYKTILQNLFFATLNTQMKKDDPKSRSFIDEAKKKDYISDGYLQQGYYRYKRFIKSTISFLEQFKNIPFLNGGLFDCLDKRTGSKEIRIDCFSDNLKNEGRLKIPDDLFFSEKEIDVDLRKHFEPDSKNRVIKKVRGLITILKSYNFTIDENTPVDEEVALDPELLGKVFENLLASYNPETRTTARKATGSYYTPREIVEYMVNESLIAYLKTALSDDTKNFEDKIRSLLDYNVEINPFENEKETIQKIIDAIESIKILDPACGSGAFPMGVLHKLVLILHKLDPENKYWYELQYQKAIKETEEAFKLGNKQEREERLKEINEAFDTSINEPNYARKLFLIRNCIYGVDIQEIAVQISKLRFFISLLIDQQTDDNKPNRGIKALPNLETKFVAANTLIGLEKLPDELFDSEVSRIIKELFKIREDFFYANSRWKKKELERKEEKLKETLVVSMQKSLQKINKERIQKLKIEIERLNKELDNLSGQPDEIEVIEIPNLFGEKEIKKINKTEAKRQEIKRRKITCENELKRHESPGKEPSIEIAKKIADFNPYDQNKSNSWFDPEWMFGIKNPSHLVGEGKDEGGFDIVIANPPYVNIYQIAENEEIVKTYQKLFFSAYKKFDLYILFLEKSINLLKSNGVLCYINSDKFMSQPYGVRIRQFILNTCRIRTICDLSKYKIFEEAVNMVSVFIFNKEKNKNIRDENIIKILLPFANQRLPNLIQCKEYEISQKLFHQTIENQFRIHLTSELLKIIRKIESNTIRLEEICYINWGCRPVPIDNFVFDRKINQKYKPFIRGKNVIRYNIHWDGKYLFYEPEKLYNPMFPELFESEKIVIQEVTGQQGLICAYDNKGYYTTHAFSICVLKHKLTDIKGRNLKISHAETKISKQYDLKYLLSLMNSQLLNIYFKLMISGELNVYPDNVKALPIKSAGPRIQKRFVDIVDHILSIYEQYGYPLSNGARLKVQELEHQVDQMVYKLYGLTDEEIKIIENN